LISLSEGTLLCANSDNTNNCTKTFLGQANIDILS
jgi:hypothetical protein